MILTIINGNVLDPAAGRIIGERSIVVEDDEIKMVNAVRDVKTSSASPIRRTQEPEQSADDADGPVAFLRQSEPRPDQTSDEPGETR